MFKKVIVIAFCLMLLTSCQSNEVNDISSEISTEATFESTISEETEQTEAIQSEVVQTEVTSVLTLMRIGLCDMMMSLHQKIT